MCLECWSDQHYVCFYVVEPTYVHVRVINMGPYWQQVGTSAYFCATQIPFSGYVCIAVQTYIWLHLYLF
jgi:pimeloyl-CoA synthetase